MKPAKYVNKVVQENTIEALQAEITRLSSELMSKKPTVKQSWLMKRIMAEYNLETAQETQRLQLNLMIKAIKRQIAVFNFEI